MPPFTNLDEARKIERELDSFFTPIAWSTDLPEKRKGERGCLATATIRNLIAEIENLQTDKKNLEILATQRRHHPASPKAPNKPPARCDYRSKVSVTWNARCLFPKGHSEAHAISVDPHDDGSDPPITVNPAIKRTCPGCGGIQYHASQWGHAATWLCRDCRREDELT